MVAGQVSSCCMPVGRQLCAQVHAPPSRLHTCAKHVTAQRHTDRRSPHAHSNKTARPHNWTGDGPAAQGPSQMCTLSSGLTDTACAPCPGNSCKNRGRPCLSGAAQLSSRSSAGSRHQPPTPPDRPHTACVKDTAARHGRLDTGTGAALFDTRSSSVAQVTTPMKWVAGGPQSKCVSCCVVLQD